MVFMLLVFSPSGASMILRNAVSFQTGLMELFFFIAAMIFGISLTVFVVNVNPTVGVTDSGIFLEGVWANYQLSWGDIALIHPTRIAFSKMWFIGSNKLTILHHVAGLIYARKNMPGFFVDNNRRTAGLISIIEEKMKENHQTP